MEKEVNISRRKFLGAAAGAAGAAAALSWPASRAIGGNDPLRVPQRTSARSCTRSAIASAAPDTTGVPYGFAQVLAALAAQGYKTIEFAGSTRARDPRPPDHAGGDPRDPERERPGRQGKSWHHSEHADGGHDRHVQGELPDRSDARPGVHRHRWRPERHPLQGGLGSRGGTLGHPRRHREGRGLLGVYNHNHDAAYNFLLDSGPLDSLGRPTRSSGIRMDEYFIKEIKKSGNTTFFMEMDIYWAHVAQHRFRTYTNPDGVVVEKVFDPAGLVSEDPHRFPLFHAKDGKRTADPPGMGSGYTMVPSARATSISRLLRPDRRQRRTIRCTSRTTLPAARPTLASRWRSRRSATPTWRRSDPSALERRPGRWRERLAAPLHLFLAWGLADVDRDRAPCGAGREPPAPGG